MITVGCPRCCGVWCVVLVLVFGRGGVVCWVLCVVWVVCVFVLFCSFFLSILFFLFLALSLSFFSLFLSSLFFPSSLFSLLSSLLATKHCGKNRSTNTAANFEAFECDLAHGRCKAVGSLPPSLPSPPYSPSPPHKKRRGNFQLQEYFRRGIYFYYSFIVNSKKSPRCEITGVTV